MKKLLGLSALAMFLGVTAGASVVTAGAAEGNSRVYRPIDGLSYNFGSKLAVGYFLREGWRLRVEPVPGGKYRG